MVGCFKYIMELEEFKNNCNNKKCLKHLRYDSKTCIRESKQLNCYKSYIRNIEKKEQKFKNNINEWEEENKFINEIWLRDTGESRGNESKRDNWKNYCRIWKSLTVEERNYLEKNYKEELWINKDLDVAHIKPKSTNIDDRYDYENVILIGRFFHRRLTDMKHPVYDTTISQIEIEEILNNAKIKGK